MNKLERKNFKPFGINARETDISQFGGATYNTKDVEEIINLDAWDTGWRAGVLTTNNNPSLQQRNAVDYSFSYQLSYLLNEGIPEWNAKTTYSIGSIVKKINGGVPSLYYSLIDDNLAKETTDTSSWKILDDIDKNKVKSLVYPDYAKKEQKTKNTTYLADKDGWVLVEYSSSDQGAKAYLKIGTTETDLTTIMTTTSNVANSSGSIYPIKKGWYYRGETTSNTYSKITYYFVPNYED